MCQQSSSCVTTLDHKTQGKHLHILNQKLQESQLSDPISASLHVQEMSEFKFQPDVQLA